MANQEPTPEVYIGIDVSKKTLDVHIHPLGKDLQVANSPAGLAELIRRLEGYRVVKGVMEATGKLHRLAHRSLHEAGYQITVVNPHRSRKLADALGRLAKTDRIDAAVLALYAARLEPAATEPKAEHLETLRDLVAARRQISADLTALGNRLGTTTVSLVAEQIRVQIAQMKGHLKALEKAIREAVKADPKLARRYEILTSIRGVGPVTATTLMAEMDELGTCSRRKIAALAGLAPMNNDSGARRGARSIRGGRASVRRVLYMAALTAMKSIPELAALAGRLKAKGKVFKKIATAVMRKLVVLANALVAQDRTWAVEAPRQTP